MSVSGEHDHIVKLRGLPWSSSADNVLDFLENCNVTKTGVHMTLTQEGRPSGVAFVELESEEDLERALNKDKEHIGSRYIEVAKVTRAEMDCEIERSRPNVSVGDESCVKLRGLPWGCSKEEIALFFKGFQIVPNGITFLTLPSRRISGKAHVQFVNKKMAEKALLKNREKIGERYIEIFRSSLAEANSTVKDGGGRSNSGMFNSRPGPYDRGDRFGGGGGNNRFQSRGSRSFKGSNFSNNMQNYNRYDRPSNWGISNHDGSNIRGGSNRRGGMGRGSYYGNGFWVDISRSRNDSHSGDGHPAQMRNLPFNAGQNNIADFREPAIPDNANLIQDHTRRAGYYSSESSNDGSLGFEDKRRL